MRVALLLATLVAAHGAVAQSRTRRATPTRAAPERTLMERVRECRSLPNDAARNPCIVAALEGRARSEQELRMLAVTYMAMGRTHDAVRVLRHLPARQGDGGLPLPGADPRGDFPYDPCRGLEGVAPDQRPPHCS